MKDKLFNEKTPQAVLFCLSFLLVFPIPRRWFVEPQTLWDWDSLAFPELLGGGFLSAYVNKKDPHLLPGSGQGFGLSSALLETKARSGLGLFWR